MRNKLYNIGNVKKGCIILALIAMLSACTVVSGQETTREYINDATITAKVKTAISNDPTLSFFKIKIETVERVVQLSGIVDSPKDAQKARKLASKIKGVKGVKSEIIVRKGKI